MMADKKSLRSFLWGALAGTITGAVSALLLAPKPGKELRRDISETAHKVGDKTVEWGRQAGEAVQTFKSRTLTLASDVKSAANRFVTDIRSGKETPDALQEIESTERDETAAP
jgi:gas vesicle protein